MKQFQKIQLDDSLLNIFRECIDDYGVADDENLGYAAEWPNNMISRHTVSYNNGHIARRDEIVKGRFDADEFALCQRLANEAKSVVGETAVGMGSEGNDAFRPFFVVASDLREFSKPLSEPSIRDAFGDTLFPLTTITVEPLTETGFWWEQILADIDGSDENEQAKYL